MSANPLFRLGHVEVFVTDIPRARAFWEGVLGFEVCDVQCDGRVVWLRHGEREFLLRPGTPPGPGARYGRSGPAVILYTDDLEGTLEALRARGLTVQGDDGPGCPCFHDPDGNWFQLVDPRHP